MKAYDQKKMTIRKSYREATNDRIKVLHREMIAANAIEKTFNKGHKQFIDKLLVEMEAEKRVKLNKTQMSWKAEKRTIGFGEGEFKFFPDSPGPATASSSVARSENNENHCLDDSLAYSAEGWGDEQYLDQPKTEGEDGMPQEDRFQDYGEPIDPTAFTSEFPNISTKTSSSSSSVRSSNTRSSVKSRQSRLTEPSKVRVFNRMSLFTALLHDTPVPSSTLGDHYGLVKAPFPSSR